MCRLAALKRLDKSAWEQQGTKLHIVDIAMFPAHAVQNAPQVAERVSTVQIINDRQVTYESDDEIILSDLYEYLRFERGMDRAAALEYLKGIPGKLDTHLSKAVMDWADDEPLPEGTPRWDDPVGPGDPLAPQHASVEAIEAAISAGEQAAAEASRG